MNSAFAATYGAPTKVPRPVPIDATSNTKEGWRIAGRTQSPPPQLIEYGERSALPKKKVGAIGVAYTTDACSAGPRRPSLGDPPRPTAIYGASKYKGGPKNEYAARCEVRLQPHYPMKADFLGPSKCANPPGNCVENVTIRGMLEAGHRNITSTVMKNSKDGVTIPMCEQCVVLVGDDVKKHPQATITDGATGVRYLMAPKRRAFSMCVVNCMYSFITLILCFLFRGHKP